MNFKFSIQISKKGGGMAHNSPVTLASLLMIAIKEAGK